MSTLQSLTYRFTLDAFKNGRQRIIHGYEVGETAVRKMEISLMYGINTYELPLGNITAVMYVKRPSQTDPSINACEIDAENNKIIYTLDDSDILEAGIVDMQLKIFDHDKILISPQFGLDVWESLIDDSQASQTAAYTALTEALAQAKAYNDKAIVSMEIDEDTYIFTVTFADNTEYTSDALANAVAEVEPFALKAEGFAVGTQDGTPVEEESEYYENNAKYYAEQSKDSADASAGSASDAADSATAASGSESNASDYKDAAYQYMTDALGYKNDASDSATAAASSESNALSYKNDAKDYKDAAAGSASDASDSATAAASSESNALSYKNDAKDYKDAAATSATNASSYESGALGYKNAAAGSASDASGYATAASNSATKAESYAVGGTDSRTGEDTDNAKYYKERCEQIAGSLEGGFVPMGTITFAQLPSTIVKGHMYNVSDAFTSDSRFEDGGGKSYGAGSNVYATAQLKWDVLASSLPVVNNKTGSSITLDGSDIKVTGYSKPVSSSAVAATDSINTAIGKVEAKADENASAITGLGTSKENVPTVLTDTLTAGVTSLTFSDAAIANTALIDVYTDTYGVTPRTMTQSGTSVALTFKAQASDVVVKLVIR